MKINFYLLRTFCPHLGRFFLLLLFLLTKFRPNFTSGLLQVINRNYRGYGYKTQHSSPRVTINHLKKVRGEIWPKCSEKKQQQHQKEITKMRTKSPQ